MKNLIKLNQTMTPDWSTLLANGIKAVVIRLGHGTTADTKAAEFIKSAKENNLIVHGYHQYEGVDNEVAWSIDNARKLGLENNAYYFLDSVKSFDIFRSFYRNWLQLGWKVGLITADDVSAHKDEFKNFNIYLWSTATSKPSYADVFNDTDITGNLIKTIAPKQSLETDPNESIKLTSGAFVGFDYSTTSLFGGKMLVSSPNGKDKIPKVSPQGLEFSDYERKGIQNLTFSQIKMLSPSGNVFLLTVDDDGNLNVKKGSD